MTEPREIALQFLVKFRSGQDYKHVDDPAGSVPVYGSGGIFASASDYLYDGESVLFGRKGTIDRPAYVCGKFWTVDTMFYTELREGVSGRWLYYWATTIPFGLYSTDTALPSMTSSVLGRIKAPLVPYVQQCAIADYLDRETAEIDAMLATLEELTETLRLRRVQAIQSSVRSSRSVGIGLMLDVKLGKMLQTKPKSPTDSLQPYLRAAHIQPGGRLDLTIDTKEMYFSEPEAEALSLRAGDAVIVEGGAGFGRAAYLTEDMPGWGFQNSIIRLRGASSDTRYAVYALQAALESGEIAIACNAATFAHFTAEKVEGFRIPYHGTDEHQRIADHLDEVTGRIDAMLATIDELKALLVERRAALITDVVTGRKKVPA